MPLWTNTVPLVFQVLQSILAVSDTKARYLNVSNGTDMNKVVGGTNLMSNSGVDGELMQQGMAMAVERNDGRLCPLNKQ